MILRRYLALGIVCVGLLLSDLVQRTVVALWVKLKPASRTSVLAAWIDMMASLVTKPLIVVGGARIRMPPRIVPAEPGTLIVMNHQSIMDIPLMVRCVKDGYPRIVTRARYQRRVPLISHMVRLYQYPVVDPTANPKEVIRAVRTMAKQAKDSDVPIGLFPEGTRTRDGEIGPFKVRGLAKLLQQRPWTVYVMVVDGYWQAARFRDFMADMSKIDGRMSHAGTFEWTDPTADSTDFMKQLRDCMVEGLAELRQGTPA